MTAGLIGLMRKNNMMNQRVDMMDYMGDWMDKAFNDELNDDMFEEKKENEMNIYRIMFNEPVVVDAETEVDGIDEFAGMITGRDLNEVFHATTDINIENKETGMNHEILFNEPVLIDAKDEADAIIKFADMIDIFQDVNIWFHVTTNEERR